MQRSVAATVWQLKYLLCIPFHSITRRKQATLSAVSCPREPSAPAVGWRHSYRVYQRCVVLTRAGAVYALL